jgi:hypothetical protein
VVVNSHPHQVSGVGIIKLEEKRSRLYTLQKDDSEVAQQNIVFHKLPQEKDGEKRNIPRHLKELCKGY